MRGSEVTTREEIGGVILVRLLEAGGDGYWVSSSAFSAMNVVVVKCSCSLSVFCSFQNQKQNSRRISSVMEVRAGSPFLAVRSVGSLEKPCTKSSRPGQFS